MDFHEALINAEEAPLNSFEKKSTLKDVCLLKSWPSVALKPCFMVPMKPVGLEYPDDYTGPRDGEFKTPYAVVQLRQGQCGW